MRPRNLLEDEKGLLRGEYGPFHVRHVVSDPLLSFGGTTVRASSNNMYAEDGSRRRKPGVYTLRSKGVLSLEALDRLYETRYLCSHNAGIFRDIGDAHKAEVWESTHAHCRWPPWRSLWTEKKWLVESKIGAALASSFIASTLRYLESVGDVQMLSTIICVLRVPTQDLQQSLRRVEQARVVTTTARLFNPF